MVQAARSDARAPTSAISMEPRGLPVEIPLDAELCDALCHRKRHRLRSLQATREATLKLDRARGALLVWGSGAAVEDVRRQLDMVSGPRKNLSGYVWAELMRTRKRGGGSQSLITKLQDASGARIHVERDELAARLFGPAESVGLADKLVDRLAWECTEVHVSTCGKLPAMTLEEIAEECGVTILVDETFVTVMGLSDPVVKAVDRLNVAVTQQEEEACRSGPGATLMGPIHESASDDASECSVEEDTHGSCVTTTAGSLPPPIKRSAEKYCRVPVTSSTQDFSYVCSECGAVKCAPGRFCPDCGGLYVNAIAEATKPAPAPSRGAMPMQVMMMLPPGSGMAPELSGMASSGGLPMPMWYMQEGSPVSYGLLDGEHDGREGIGIVY